MNLDSRTYSPIKGELHSDFSRFWVPGGFNILSATNDKEFHSERLPVAGTGAQDQVAGIRGLWGHYSEL